MKTITHNTLLFTFVFTIAVVLGSIFIILGKIGFVTDIMTGYGAFATGVVNITIQRTAGITLVTTNVTFGTGQLNGDGSVTRVNNSVGITNPSTFNEPIPFTLRVDGNSPVNISFNGTAAATFLGGTSPSFIVNVTNHEAGSCGGINNYTESPGGAINVEVTAAYQQLCNNTDFTDTGDEINITVFLAIPADTPAAAKNATLNFRAVVNASSANP